MKRLISTSVLAAALLLIAFGSAGAEAKSPVYSYETNTSSTQAGGHPDIEVGFEVGNRATQGYSNPCFCNDPKIITAHLPTGVIGNPHVTPQCTTAQFAKDECPIDSQIGVVGLLLFNTLETEGYYFLIPLYNMIPQAEQAGLLAFAAPLIGNPIYVELNARTDSDFGLDATTVGIERFVPVFGIHQILWGAPAAPIHDALRTAESGFCQEIMPEIRENKAPKECYGENPPPPVQSNSPELPFMSNPTTCGGPLLSTLDTLAFDHETDHGETFYPAITGCDQLSFNPSLSAQPTTAEADSASGLDIDLKVPQLQSPTTPSPSQIKAATVTLPEGFTINPNAADGKVSCSDQEASFGTRKAADCPEFSKIGTVTLDSSALPGPIPGFLYLGEPLPGDRYRLIFTGDGYATHIKLKGTIKPDPQTGRIVTAFPDLPQSPLTEFKMHIFGSERGILATPTQCGQYTVNSTFTPWDAALAEQKATQFFNVDHGPGGTPCPSSPRGFDPAFEAASVSNTAGAYTPFTAIVERHDGSQNLTGVDVTTPTGFSASLKGIPYCSESAIERLSSSTYSGVLEQASPACPAASQVGTAAAAAGAGSRPLNVGGKVYLAGPYKGAPLSLEVVIPAVSGPYDLGNVAVRIAIDVDPVTAQVTASTDPLPQILEGIPFRTRSVQLSLDRSRFTINPTDCSGKDVKATISGDEGGSASRNTHFQVANCANLPFAPSLSLQLSGGVKRRGHPAIHAVFTPKAGEANSKRVTVTLPKGELLDNGHIETICTRVDFAKDACPAGSVLGEGEAKSPLIDEALRGKIYLRASDNKLPDLVLDLEGQIDIELAARIDSVNGRLRTTFESLPDVPVSSFKLDLLGGKRGLLQNTESLCGKSKSATVKSIGHNGVKASSRTKLKTSCGSGSRPKRHARGKGA